jgi:glycine/D-amino acid oxidase-like deaminating enzyme
MTSYFTLKNTGKKVILLEADKIAHGATGHNAGQITSYFERPFYDIADEFGLPMAAHGQKAVEDAWSLLEELVKDCALRTPVYKFTGYAGYTSLEQLMPELKNNAARVKAGLSPDQILVAEGSSVARQIPLAYKKFYRHAPHKEILAQLETENPTYVASMSQRKGCTNSALLVEELVGYMAAKFPERFSFFEQSRVTRVVLQKQRGVVEIGAHRVSAPHIVLCTNGFENFHIINEVGPDIETIFHHTVRGRIGYMAGYIEESQNPPTALSYYPKIAGPNFDPTGEPYFYLTRRPYEHGEHEQRLVCIGGPEKVLPNDAIYMRDNAGSEEIQWQDDEFLQANYRYYPRGVNYAFLWHGLMGYTPNKLRRIGYEPLNPTLMYNLGCNGVGILPSIYGGKRISLLLAGKELEPSIFDPDDQRSFKTMLTAFFRYLKKHRQRVR